MQFPNVFQLLANVTHQIILEPTGLDHLKSLDEIAVITIHGEHPTFTGELFQSHSGKNIRQYGNSIWISTKPIYSKKLKKNIVFLKTSVNKYSEEALQITNLVCSLLSNVVVVLNYTQVSLKFLAKIPASEREDTIKRRDKVAMVVGARFLQKNENFTENLTDFENQLVQQNITNDITLSYPSRSAYDISTNASHEQFFNFLEQISLNNFGNTFLMFGPILSSYLFNITEQFNRGEKINIEAAEQEIEIDEAYDQYLKARDNYNSKAVTKLGDEPKNNMSQILGEIRKETEDEFPCKDGLYLKKLDIYIERKEEEIKQANEELHEKRNIKILQTQSARRLKTIKQHPNPTYGLVEKEIQKLTISYEKEAGGKNKEKLFSQYINLFAPTLYKQANVGSNFDKKMDKLNKENERLESEIKNLRKQEDKCCTIM